MDVSCRHSSPGPSWPAAGAQPADPKSLSMLGYVAAAFPCTCSTSSKAEHVAQKRTQLITLPLLWAVKLVSCCGLHVCFVKSVSLCILFLVSPLFPLVSQLTRSPIDKHHSNRHSYTPIHECDWTKFGSHHCLPYLHQVCASVHSCSGFLLCLLSLVALKKSLTFKGVGALLPHTLTHIFPCLETA